MSKIRIKNFGPIKEGYLENDGWINLGKITVFIGNQGSGKSTVAKAISVMTWLEKALVRGDFEVPQSLAKIKGHFDFQNLKNYFREDRSSIIEYRGNAFDIDCIHYSGNPTKLYIRKIEDFAGYKLPKIMYVPAERNFLSVVRNAFDVTGLPAPLSTFGEELRRTQQELEGDIIDLPINNVKYQYDAVDDASYVIGQDGHRLNLNEASSGFQSIIPLYLVSQNLSERINSKGAGDTPFSSSLLSINQRVRMAKEIGDFVSNPAISEYERLKIIEDVMSKYISSIFINIVEEPEQNLYPSSQKKILESLLEFNNMTKGNKLIMTTHSPYLINYLTLAVKAGELKNKIGENENLQNQLNQIVPSASTINSNDLSIYELDEKNGSIKRLAVYDGLPSDENELNMELGETNELFAQLLEIEQSI